MKRKYVILAVYSIIAASNGWSDPLKGRVILEVGLLQKEVVEEYARSDAKYINLVRKTMYDDLLKSGLQPRQYIDRNLC